MTNPPFPHGSYWKAGLCLISLLQWAAGCWAQRVALCLPPQIALRSPCSGLQKASSGLLKNIPLLISAELPLVFFRCWRFCQRTAGPDKVCAETCCKYAADSAAYSMYRARPRCWRGQAAGGQIKPVLCYCGTEDFNVQLHWRRQIQCAASPSKTMWGLICIYCTVQAYSFPNFPRLWPGKAPTCFNFLSPSVLLF